MEPVAVDEWIRRYVRAWETGDEDLLSSLFTEEATYRSGPFRDALTGQAEIRRYWRDSAGGQSDVHVRIGAPYIDGARVAVEWWATMLDDGETLTLPGCLHLRFAEDGRCVALREYWHAEPGRHEPFPEWGT